MLGGISKWTMLRMLGLSMPMPKAIVAGNTISSISSGKSTLGLTIPNAILAINLGSSLVLQVVITSSISAGSGVGGISGRETCEWVSHHTSSDVDGIHAVHHRSSIQLHRSRPIGIMGIMHNKRVISSVGIFAREQLSLRKRRSESSDGSSPYVKMSHK